MISRLERGERDPSEEVVHALADALEIEPRLLGEQVLFEARSEEVHFRHRARTPAPARYAALGHSTLLAELVNYFDANLRLPPVRLPASPVDLTVRCIEAMAKETRGMLGLPDDRPLSSMTETLEAAGIPVVLSPRGSECVDAFSIDRGDARPIVVLNLRDSGSRINFTGAHELGHLVLHQGMETGSRETESQADRFASAFLMPAKAFAQEFPRQRGRSLDWGRLKQLKVRWRVSMQAMIRRAHDLNLIRSTTYRLACQYASSQGWRRPDPGEPGEFAPDQPTLLRECFDAASSHLGVSPARIADRLAWTPEMLKEVACMPDLCWSEADEVSSSVVVPFTRRRPRFS